jgi:hypothetical protein
MDAEFHKDWVACLYTCNLKYVIEILAVIGCVQQSTLIV